MMTATTVPVAFLTPLLDGLSWGVMLVLLSLGLTLVFGFLEVINFAHGAFYMLGGYIAFAVTDATGIFWLGLIVAPLAVFALGVVVEVLTLRRSYEYDPITQMLITLGITLVLEAGVLIIWGETSKSVEIPNILSNSIQMVGITYPVYRIFITIVGFVIVASVWLFLQYSRIGLVIRASLTENTMAQALGNDIPRIYTFVFASGVAIAAVAGALITPMRGIDPQVGIRILPEAFIVVVAGGLGSLRGTIVAGIIIGMIDIFIASWISFQLSGITVFAILVVVLVLKPQGLFGKEGVMTE